MSGVCHNSPRYVEQLGAPPDCIPDIYVYLTRLQLNTLGQMSRQELTAAQNQDSLIGPTICAMQCGRWPDDIKSNPEMMVMKREKEMFVMRNGLLHRVSKSHTGDKTEQLVLPPEFRAAVLKSMHDDLGHLGAERTTDMIRSRFFWPKMAVSVDQYVKNCGVCPEEKSRPESCPTSPDSQHWANGHCLY